MTEILYTVPGAAERLGVGTTLAYLMIKDGRMAAESQLRDGHRAAMVTPAEVERIIGERTAAYTAQDVADALGVSRQTIKRLIWAGEIKAEKRTALGGQHWAITEEEFRRLITA